MPTKEQWHKKEKSWSFVAALKMTESIILAI
jgi:hypothetical protein